MKSIGFFGSHIIAAVRSEAGLSAAAQSSAPAVFLLGSDILTLERQVGLLHERGKKVFLHIDLTEGIASDSKGVRYVAKRIAPDGLISTRPQVLRFAKDEGMLTVQRLFLVDSSSLETGERMIGASRPDYMEVLPGLAPKAIIYFYENIATPIIAGGMITSEDDIIQAITAGAIAVSTSKQELWGL